MKMTKQANVNVSVLFFFFLLLFQQGFIITIHAFPVVVASGFRSDKLLSRMEQTTPSASTCSEDHVLSSPTTTSSSPNQRRRIIMDHGLLMSLSMLFVVSPETSFAEDAPKKTFLKGTVDVKPDVTLPPDTTSSALYITARPNKPDNVPRAILDGSNGKPPPVLATRISNPSFPVDFVLTDQDLTPEGATATTEEEEEDSYWFDSLDLIVSARWDTDGVAASRDPTDLVGRTIGNNQNDVALVLSGRGFTGKLVTNKSKP